MSERLQDLILVAGHAAFKKSVQDVSEHPEEDEGWVLQEFQIGEPPFYIEHIRRGVMLAINNPVSLLIFSGGRTRKEVGKWSEASTYYEIAKKYNWWIPLKESWSQEKKENSERLRENFSERTITEDYARDSFENLLFGICRFQKCTEHYPRNVTVVSWAFKKTRFEFHRTVIHFPVYRFHFDGVNEPMNLVSAWKGEVKAIRDFCNDWYGYDPNSQIGRKRKNRDPFNQDHPYRDCPGMKDFFEFIENPANKQKDFPGRLPWEED